MDFSRAAVEVLPEVVDTVAGRVPVLLDSGVRRGSDVLKALALGAKGVLLGRPICWGLGAAGPLGVDRVLNILRDELKRVMILTGRQTVAEVDRTLLCLDDGNHRPRGM